ncbi:MAG TPA: helix-turn-helix domain-containing protein [Gemmatimonadaceae bacterium]|nr:helix-turn-helix domain-containing protein [Gemmatimonadaceae bacterium]
MPTIAHAIPKHVPEAPAGYKGARAAILVALKRAGELTAPALASQLGASLNAIKHHLKELEREALIVYARQRQPLGAPVFVYRLSESGEALFPRRYEATLLDVLDRLAEREGREAAVAMVTSRFDSLRERLEAELEGASIATRIERVTQTLHDEGYMAESTMGAGDPAITEHNCAIRAVAERFPEVCAAEARFLSSLLGAPVERQQHILAGCGACEYRVRLADRRPTDGE